MSQNVNLAKRLPPQSIEAERALLGACLLDKAAANSVQGIVAPLDFYAESHRLIFAVICQMVAENQPCDPVTVSDALKVNGDLERIGGVSYISSLLDSVPAPSAAVYYAQMIRDKAHTRALMEAASAVLAKGYEGSFNAEELQNYAESAIFDVVQGRQSQQLYRLRDLMQPVFDVISQIKSEGGVIGVPTFGDLDRQYLSGLRASDLVLLAARPGVGKTSMAINIAQQAASKHGKTVAVFSLEMPKEQLVQRILCSEARVDSDRVRKGMASKQDLRRLAKAVNTLSGAELYINDTMKVSISDIRSQCRKLKLDHGLDLVVIDYVQLMQGAPGKRTENRQLEVADISRSLKAMAKELDVPVLALSQLSRMAEQKNEEPNLSHLRESGALEQDADVVILLHRPRKTEEEESSEEEQLKRNKHSETIEVIVAKHRNGPAGRLTMNFIKEFTLFTDFAQDWVGGASGLTPPPDTAMAPPDDDAPF